MLILVISIVIFSIEFIKSAAKIIKLLIGDNGFTVKKG